MTDEKWHFKDVHLFTIRVSDVTEWFRTHIGTMDSSWYESTTSNLIAQNSGIICRNAIHIWREQELGAYGKRSRLRPDVIIASETELWIVEVKYPVSTTEIFGDGRNKWGVCDQLYEYRNRIKKLRWWADKKLQLAAVWVYEEAMVKRKKIANEHRVHPNLWI